MDYNLNQMKQMDSIKQTLCCPFILEDNMAKHDVLILTNNPLVRSKYENDLNLIYEEISFVEILERAKKLIESGHRLLTHPLSGSIKPKETPYKSIMLEAKSSGFDAYSWEVIARAIDVCKKFTVRYENPTERVLEDFQLVDCTLIESAFDSAFRFV